MNKIAKLFLYGYIIAKPYYLFNSGSLQISDLFLVIAFILLLFSMRQNREQIKRIISENNELIVFIFFTFIINTIHCLLFPDNRFILSTLYYIFDLIAIIAFTCVINEEKFRNTTAKLLIINLLIQVVLYVAGAGRFWHTTNRYTGTFNDPNQLGYYVLLSLSYIILFVRTLDMRISNAIIAICFMLSAYLIFLSQSTAMILGLGSLAILIIGQNIGNIKTHLRKNITRIIIIVIFAVPLLLLMSLIININPQTQRLITSKTNDVLVRINQKIDKTSQSSSESNNIFEDRALDYIYLYPEKIIYGAGEGGETNYDKVNHYTEIHSTLPALLFYYGIIPFIFVIKWIVKKIKSLNKTEIVIYIALLIESFFLANQRQALFWVIIAIAPYISMLIRNKEAEK